jgi:molecular chaperone GrpE
MTSRDDIEARPVIRDRRRIDPVTGKVREPAQQDRPDQPDKTGKSDKADEQARHEPRHAATGDDPAAQLTERTADLQRVQAEYANYRKRVERDRVAVREQALANVLAELLPILDNIGRAREHGELSGGFKSVAESIEAAATKLGLVKYGEAGEPFDPNVHEALMHSFSDEVTEPTCVQILQPGYKVAERILRPARVAVAEPGDLRQPGDSEAVPDSEAAPDSEPPDSVPSAGAADGTEEPAGPAAQPPPDRGEAAENG